MMALKHHFQVIRQQPVACPLTGALIKQGEYAVIAG